jgi:hypothetical protein
MVKWALIYILVTNSIKTQHYYYDYDGLLLYLTQSSFLKLITMDFSTNMLVRHVIYLL